MEGLGWSSYYLRSRARVDLEPLATETAPSPEARRPRTAPVSAMRQTTVTSTLDTGMSKGTTPGLGINNAGYHSTQAVSADQERRQLHFGDDGVGGSQHSVSDPRTPGRTMERDPWVGGGFEQHVVTQTTLVNTPVGTPMVQQTVVAERFAAQPPTVTGEQYFLGRGLGYPSCACACRHFRYGCVCPWQGYLPASGICL